MKKITSSIYSFEQLIGNDFLYVDKTEYIWKLIEPAPAMYFMARPRRFGKSLAVSTLKELFSGRRELFSGLAIDRKKYGWKKHPVIHLDMNGWSFSTPEGLLSSLCSLIQSQASVHNITLPMSSPEAMFRELITQLAKQNPVVILLDEYDKPILNNIGKPNIGEFLEILKAFYSVIKKPVPPRSILSLSPASANSATCPCSRT